MTSNKPIDTPDSHGEPQQTPATHGIEGAVRPEERDGVTHWHGDGHDHQPQEPEQGAVCELCRKPLAHPLEFHPKEACDKWLELTTNGEFDSDSAWRLPASAPAAAMETGQRIHDEHCRGYQCTGWRCEVKDAAEAALAAERERIADEIERIASVAAGLVDAEFARRGAIYTLRSLRDALRSTAATAATPDREQG